MGILLCIVGFVAYAITGSTLKVVAWMFLTPVIIQIIRYFNEPLLRLEGYGVELIQ